ncbi:MAG: pitrilysin family protein [Planctomycetota bacterium]|nr:pitrilysin family protein [Planctomycetota bacterium]
MREHRLRNGLRLLLVERHADPVVSVILWYGVGARHESETESGMAHFLEHMMFKGSTGFAKGEVDRLTARLGGNNNAFTTADHTAYWFEFAADRWEQALVIEADRMVNLTLDEKEFISEREVVLEELSMGEDDPWRCLSRRVQRALFQRHPYGEPVVGRADRLRRMTVEDMAAWHRRYYHPGNATLMICGDFSSGRALRLVRQHFGSLVAGEPLSAVEPYRPPLTEPAGPQRLEMSWDDPMARLCLAWPTVKAGEDADWALDVVTTVLTGGRLGRLYRRLVLEEGLATTISTSNDTRVEGGAFWLFAEAAPGVAPEQLESAIWAEFELLAREGVCASDLKVARRILAASEAYSRETVTDLAEDIGEWAVDVDWRLALAGPERWAQVRTRQVREVVARYLTPARCVTGLSLPPEGNVAGGQEVSARARRKVAGR